MRLYIKFYKRQGFNGYTPLIESFDIGNDIQKFIDYYCIHYTDISFMKSIINPNFNNIILEIPDGNYRFQSQSKELNYALILIY